MLSRLLSRAQQRVGMDTKVDLEICVLSQPGTRVAGWYFGVAPGVCFAVDGSEIEQ